MKIKKVDRESKEFKKALNESEKESDMRGIYAQVPFTKYKKLKDELFKLRMPLSKWVIKKIEEIK